MIQRSLSLAALAAVSLLALAGPASAATITTGSSLPLHGFSHMIVDGAHGHVFVTGSPSDSSIVVRNEDGSAAGTISGEAGAGGMVIDGGTLYVARCGWDVIDEIDTATLAKVGSFAAAVGGTCDLAEAGGRLWYSNSTDHQWGHLVSVSLDSSHTAIDSGEDLYQMTFATTAVHPSWLAIVEAGLSPTVAYVFDVADPAGPSQVDYQFDLGGGGGNPGDIAISPDGSTFFVAAGAPYEIDAFSLPGLAAAGVYPTTPYPVAVAVSPDGTELVGGSANGASGHDVYRFHTGNATVAGSWDMGSAFGNLYARGLAYSEDGTHVFAISRTSAGSGAVLHVVSTTALPAGSLTLEASRVTVLVGKSATLTAHLRTASSNRRVSFYRRPASGGSAVLVGSSRADGSGYARLSISPTANAWYTAVWSGDPSHAQTTSARVSVKVKVTVHAPAQGGYATRSSYRLYHYASGCHLAAHRGCPHFLAYATPLHPGGTLSFRLQIRTASGSWKTALTGAHAAGSSGKLVLTIYYSSKAVVGVRQRIRFSVASDAAHVGNTSSWTYFRVTR